VRIDAVLMCARCRAPTLHLFVERRPQRRSPGEPAFVDLVYGCDACGAPRSWGNEPREATAYGRRLGEASFAHAVDIHGMRRQACRACRGAGLDCGECGDEGEIWAFKSPEACGPNCPLRGVAARVSE
jgi:hypothetical protein